MYLNAQKDRFNAPTFSLGVSYAIVSNEWNFSTLESQVPQAITKIVTVLKTNALLLFLHVLSAHL
jgi:hypothetical protein